MGDHWPEYATEAAGLALIMLVSALATTVVTNSLAGLAGGWQRVIEAACIAGTVLILIYSPWGRQSGAHFNPAVTLTFFLLGRVWCWDAACYIGAQFAGGVAGIWAAAQLAGPALSRPPVLWIITHPGVDGPAIAFVAECLIAFTLMGTVLLVGGTTFAPLAGACSAAWLFAFVCLEAPLSGCSMNPARSFASALLAARWGDFWIYAAAPPLGMVAAAAVVTRVVRTLPRMHCAKLLADPRRRCIHCGLRPGAGGASGRGCPAVDDRFWWRRHRACGRAADATVLRSPAPILAGAHLAGAGSGARLPAPRCGAMTNTSL
jgi:aquaporin Z